MSSTIDRKTPGDGCGEEERVVAAIASGYGHLRYRLFSWQPIPADRAIRIDVEKVG